MDFQIYTMYVNRRDLLENAIASVGAYADRVVVIDNSPDQDLSLPGFPGEIIVPPVPLFCSQSYNLILKLAIERNQEYFYIMHSDAVASASVVDKALAIGVRLSEEGLNWGILFTNYDVLCLHRTAALKDFRWDQNLPLYYTDVDFYYRLRLAGVLIVESGLESEVQHVQGGSMTLKNDPAVKHFVEINYPAWRQYYIAKWGGERNAETFTTPFMRPSQPDEGTSRTYKDVVPDYAEYLKLQTTTFESFEELSPHIVGSMRTTFTWLTKDLPAGSKILDAACGDGTSLAILKEQGFSPVGIEFNTNKLKIAEGKGKAVQGDLHDLGMFQDAEFDAILSSHTLEHMYDPAKVFREFRRVLKPGGSLLVVLPYPDMGNEQAHGGKYALGTDISDSGRTVLSFFQNAGFDVMEHRLDVGREPEIWINCVRS